MGQDKGSLIKQKQRLLAEANENEIYSLIPISRWCPDTSQKAELQYA